MLRLCTCTPGLKSVNNVTSGIYDILIVCQHYYGINKGDFHEICYDVNKGDFYEICYGVNKGDFYEIVMV